MITILKELRIAKLCSKNERTLTIGKPKKPATVDNKENAAKHETGVKHLIEEKFLKLELERQCTLSLRNFCLD